MPATAWTLLALAALILCLDAYAMRKVFVSSLYGPGQLCAQVALILLLPILGAYLALYMCRGAVPLFQKPPVDHVQDIDPICSDIDYPD
jgi:hypothetical protein